MKNQSKEELKSIKVEKEISELRNSVSDLARNYSELLKTANEYFIMAKPLVKVLVEKMEEQNQRTPNVGQ